MANINGKVLATCFLAIGLIGCGKSADDKSDQIVPAETAGGVNSGAASSTIQWTESSELNMQATESQASGAFSAVLDLNEIPYPIYPNGSKYRIGGLGDLKIVLFQTEDTFEEVDAYYQQEANLPRLSAMSDYVRYSIDNNDIDPWETSRPGIVIHQFNDDAERDAVGADDKAVTNIIMSFE